MYARWFHNGCFWTTGYFPELTGKEIREMLAKSGATQVTVSASRIPNA